jgi:hypothetical protein
MKKTISTLGIESLLVCLLISCSGEKPKENKEPVKEKEEVAKVDVGKSGSQFLYFNDHCQTKRKQVGPNTWNWEIKMKVFNDTYKNDAPDNSPVTLQAGKKMGFMVAYSDNDKSKTRESFMGSSDIKGPDKNAAWVDASLFGIIVLQ